MRDLVIGIDIGGTKIAVGLQDQQGNLLSRSFTNSYSGCMPEKVIEAVVHMVDLILKEAGVSKNRILGAGVGCAGHVNSDQGIVLTNSNLPGWNYYPLKETLEKIIDLPVFLDNDANCAAWGEFRYGMGQGSRHMCYLTFSTGCGMGIIIDRKLYRGALGTAGEIGHTVINPDGPLCSCGKHGCLMSYACGMALSQMAEDCLKNNEKTLLNELCSEKSNHIPAEKIAQAARQGDAVAIRLLNTAGHYFGIGLSTVVQILNPDTIVIGGGLTQIGSLLLDPCLKSLNENIHPVLRDSAHIHLSKLQNDACVIGAGSLIWENFHE
ncbi:MAG: ROK family protein [Leptolinea sp.]|nr:ROK family protein [Leptolinea sp.]